VRVVWTEDIAPQNRRLLAFKSTSFASSDAVVLFLLALVSILALNGVVIVDVEEDVDFSRSDSFPLKESSFSGKTGFSPVSPSPVS
jgi:hypothetical protein